MDKSELHGYIAEREPNICQVVCMRDGSEIYSDEWNGFGRNDAYHVMSVTKSVVSLLVGICSDRGLLNIDDRVMEYFPDYKIKRGEKTIGEVTIRNLLTMTAPYKYKYEPWSRICVQNDWTSAALDFLGGRSGITGKFRYSTLGIHILCGIMAKATGMNTVDFANENLFAPAGIAQHRNYLAETAEEHKKFTISKAPRENLWFCDPMGVGTAGYGLCFSASDMAKLGQLCLNRGSLNGKQLISPEWIAESTSVHVHGMNEFAGMAYGYLWWIIDESEGSYAAIGNSGNVIYVNPARGFVAAITAYFKPAVYDRVDFVREVLEGIK